MDGQQDYEGQADYSCYRFVDYLNKILNLAVDTWRPVYYPRNYDTMLTRKKIIIVGIKCCTLLFQPNPLFMTTFLETLRVSIINNLTSPALLIYIIPNNLHVVKWAHFGH